MQHCMFRFTWYILHPKKGLLHLTEILNLISEQRRAVHYAVDFQSIRHGLNLQLFICSKALYFTH
jgi:hypothetical protein